MDLDRALAISFLLHLTLVGFLFLKFKEKPGPMTFSSVELIQLKPAAQKPQRERSKGKKEILKKTEPQLKEISQAPEKDNSKGQDNEDAPAIEGGNTSDPRLVAVATYAQELQSFIERNRYYPRRALMMEQTGTVKVELRITPDGRFASVEVMEASPHPILNQAAQDLVTQLKAFKPLPSSYSGNGTFIIPIKYNLKDQSI